MTVSTNNRRFESPGNGSTVVFAGPRIFSTSQLAVYEVDDTTQVATLLALGDDYTVTGLGDDECSITMMVAPADGKTLLRLRTVPYAQSVRFKNQGAFLPELHENMGDLLAMQIQQLADTLGNALRLPDEFAGTRPSTILPSTADAAGLYIRMKLDGTGFEFVQGTIQAVPGGAPNDAGYLVSALSADLSGERVLMGVSGQTVVSFATPEQATVGLAETGITAGVYSRVNLQVDAYGRIVAIESGSAGAGDVVGPASAVTARLATFDGTTGKMIQDGGKTIAEVMAEAQVAARTPNVQTVTSSATVTPTFSNDLVKITAQAAGLTLANPTGTPIDGLGMVIRIKDNGTPRTIAYGSHYRAMGITLPTTTIVSKTLYLAMIYNSNDTKWDVVAVGQEA